MLMDFNAIPEVVQEHFKGGLGELHTKMYADGTVRVLLGRLTPGSTIGLHVHEGNFEIIYILSGVGKMLCDGAYEPLSAGSCHYCPQGHEHSLINNSADDLCFFAVVPKHRSYS